MCENLDDGWQETWVEEQKVPYAVYQDQWVGYESQKSVQIKVRKMIEKFLRFVMLLTEAKV